MITYVWSQCRHRPQRLLGVVAGVALGAALYLLIAALGNGFRLAARAPLRSVGADLVVSRAAAGADTQAAGQRTRGVRTPFGLGAFSAAEAEAMGRDPGVAASGAGLLLWDFGPSRYTTVLGVGPGAAAGPGRGDPGAAAGPGPVIAASLLEGRALLPGETGTVVVDQHYALFFRVKPGAMVTIGDRAFQVVGITGDHSDEAAANLYISLDDAWALAAVPADTVNQVYLKATDASQVDGIVARITTARSGLQVTTESSVLRLMGGIGRITARFASVAAGVALGGGLLLAWLVVGGLVAERRSEIGLMVALGWRRGDVIRIFVAEALILGAVGAITGVALGFGVAWLLGRLPGPSSASSVHQALSSLHGAPQGLEAVAAASASPSLPVQAMGAEVLLALATVITVVGLAAWYGVRRSLRLRAGTALRPW